MIINIDPVPKPRMTQSDRWKKRQCCLNYWEFKDKIRKEIKALPEHPRITFYIEMPASWSKKKRSEMLMQPHKQKPDIDNLIKALFDAVYGEDSHIWNVYAEKRWALTGYIEINEPAQRND